MAAASVICMSKTLARMVRVRSDRTSMPMSAGIQRLISGSTAMTPSAVSITLASACRVMFSSTEGRRLNQAAERLLRTPCSMVAMAPSRTTVPFSDLDHEVLVVLRLAKLVAAADAARQVRALEAAERAAEVRGLHCVGAPVPG